MQSARRYRCYSCQRVFRNYGNQSKNQCALWNQSALYWRLNPNTVFPDDYEQFALFRDNKYAELVSFNTIYVGNLRYAPAVKKWYWRNDAYSDYTINFAKRCEYCHGTGLVNEKMCSNCGGNTARSAVLLHLIWFLFRMSRVLMIRNSMILLNNTQMISMST